MLLRVLSSFLLALVAMAAATQGVYYIDDTDPSITWVGEWLHLNESFQPDIWADASKCYNQTFTVSDASTDEHYSMQIPFTGTGITLYVAYNNGRGLNVSVTLDSNFTTINWFITDVDFNGPEVTTYNATLYDNQDLDDGDHVLEVTIQDYAGSKSDMVFDYAEVVGQRRPISSGLSNNKIRAGIGGGVAALAVMAALALVVLCSRRRSRQKASAVELNLMDPDAKDPSLFRRASANLTTTFKPGHNRHHSSFSESATSPISPVKPVYGRFLGQKHPFQQIHS